VRLTELAEVGDWYHCEDSYARSRKIAAWLLGRLWATEAARPQACGSSQNSGCERAESTTTEMKCQSFKTYSSHLIGPSCTGELDRSDRRTTSWSGTRK